METTIKEIALKKIHIEDSFWSSRQKLITDVVLPYQEKILSDEIPEIEKSHAFANFKIAAGMEKGEFYGMVFQDSDVAKWLEAVAYSLSIKVDKELEKRADQVIDTIVKAQQPDGYLNTYFTIKDPEHRWTNLHECHELYCAGHMMEAAVAYFETTGKNTLLNVTERLADHIEQKFHNELYHGIPGHQEIEIGLLRLYKVTGIKRYLDLTKYFIDERGKNPEYFIEETKKRGWKHEIMDPYNTKYNQTYAPVREQKTAEGHSVRAVYMYTAMADLAKITNDTKLYQACRKIWDNLVTKKMYITGGIGSNSEGESFTIDYDLPNDSVYAETCASVGLAFFARKMLDIEVTNRYTDILEKVLYNGILSGMQADGRKFFYVNPLEVNPGISGVLFGYKHVLPQRPNWYACACCPPNVARIITSLGNYAWSESEDIVYSHLYLGGTVNLKHAKIEVKSLFPWEGNILYRINEINTNNKFTISFRIPSYARDAYLFLNDIKISYTDITKDGYVYLERFWKKGDKVRIIFEMPVRKIHCNSLVRHNIDCVALMRGPIVYCFEGTDNGENLQELHVLKNGTVELINKDDDSLCGKVELLVEGTRIYSRDSLYFEGKFEREDCKLKAIPYYAWGNRGLNQMRVWMHEDKGDI